MRTLRWGHGAAACALLLIASPLIRARDLEPLPEEAPEALLETRIGDQEVDLYLSGSWTAGASGAVGLVIGPDGRIGRLDAFPGFAGGFSFLQQPDLTFSVWLMQRYFFEFSVLGSFDRNAFRFGYRGEESSVLRSLEIGNREIGLPPYPYLRVPDTGDSSLGIEAGLASGSSSHDLLLRFDNNGTGSMIFIGRNEVSETPYSLGSYTPGRFFRLPDADVTGLELYLEDASGTFTGDDGGRRYRRAGYDEAVLDSLAGTVRLDRLHGGRILVTYRDRTTGDPIGDAGLGRNAVATVDAAGAVDPDTPDDFDWSASIAYLDPPNTMADRRKVTLDGAKECLLLWEPNGFSPFEFLGSYPLPEEAPEEAWRTRVSLVRRGSVVPYPGHPVSFRVLVDQGRFEAFTSEDLRDLGNLYPLLPLADIDPAEPVDRLYGPFRDTADGTYSWQLLVQILRPVAAYLLEPGLIPGSVRVYRGDEEETRFRVDADTGELVFLTPVGPNERIEVTYGREGADLNNGDVLFAWGNRFPLPAGPQVTASMAARWNAIPGAFSERSYSRTGAVVASASFSRDSGTSSFRMQAGLSYSHPDTTGLLRLLGMENAGIEIDLSEELAYPASVPDPGLSGMSGVDATNRGELYYRDYRDYGPFGSADLQDLDWTPAPEQLPYATGSRPGPYLVREGPSTERPVSLALEFDLDGPDSWVGFQVPVVPGSGPLDLSSLRSLFCSFRALDVSQTVDVYVQIGEIDENLDDDSRTLDSEPSPLSTGFLFNDGGAALLVGGGPRLEGNFLRDSEDRDGNGFLDPEAAENILSVRIGAGIVGSTDWSDDSGAWLFADEDPDYFKKLERVRGVRVIVVQTAGVPCKGKLLFNRLRLDGSSFGVCEAPASGVVSVREIFEEAADSAPPKQIEAVFPEVAAVFHPYGEQQKVLEARWTGLGGSDTWTLQGFPGSGTDGARYDEIVLYMRWPGFTGSPAVQFELLDAEERGIRWGFQPSAPFSGWNRLVVHIEERKVLLGDAPPVAGYVTTDPDYGSLRCFRVSMAGSDGGTLYLDELHLRSPRGAFGGGGRAEASLLLPGSVLSFRGVPVLANVILNGGLSLKTPGFASLYGPPSSAWSTLLSSDISFDLLSSSLGINLILRGRDADFALSGGHVFDLPLFDRRLSLQDSYDLQAGAAGFDFNRANTLSLNCPSVGSLHLASGSFARDRLLRQEWSGDFLVRPREGLSLQAAAELGKSAGGYDHGEGWYVPSWILGYRFLAPWTGAIDLERSASARVRLLLPPAPAGFDLDAEIGYESGDIGSASRSQAHSFEFALSLPLGSAGPSGLRIAPDYSRIWSARLRAPEPGGVVGDIGETWRVLTSQPYVINQAPVWEIFSDAAETEFSTAASSLESASYEPRLGLSVSRNIRTHWSSLLLPTRIDMGIGKLMSKQGDLTRFLTFCDLSLSINAINLFGRLGAYELFPFYDLDEISTLFNMQIQQEDGSDVLQSYDLSTTLILEKETDRELILDNVIRLNRRSAWSFSEEAGLTYGWSIRPETPLRLPFLGPEITAGGYFTHRESLSVAAANRRPDASAHLLTVSLGHESAVRLPDHGYLLAAFSLGYDWEAEPSGGSNDSRHRIAAELRLEAQVRF